MLCWVLILEIAVLNLLKLKNKTENEGEGLIKNVLKIEQNISVKIEVFIESQARLV